MKKQRKLKMFFICLGVLLVALIGLIYWGNTAIQTTYYTISDTEIPQSFSGFRIVQISDLHSTEFGKDNQRLLDEISDLKPDIIVLTGDLIDSRNTDFQIAASFAGKAAGIAPTYYISGNHEAQIADYDYSDFTQQLTDFGVIILNDSAVLLEQDDNAIQLMGLCDPVLRQQFSHKTDSEIMTELKQDMYSVLLVHNPENMEAYANCNMDLVLSGHVHGGQFRIPFLGGLFAPGQGFFPKYDAGLYEEGDTKMIVSRGLGNSLFPFRLNNRPEIVVVDLKSQ